MEIVIVSMIRKSWAQSVTSEDASRTRQGMTATYGIENYSRSTDIDGIRAISLVRASALDVTGLLAAVANALSGCLLGAVSGKMADLTAWTRLETSHHRNVYFHLQL